MNQEVLAYDLGGTKVAVGVVNTRGEVVDEIREPVRFAEGKSAVIRQLSDIGKKLLARHPKIRRVGIASAGPLDPARGLLLDPTNFARGGKRWGEVPLARLVGGNLKRKTVLENDAAAAVLAEAWIGAAKGYGNAMVLTLGTGLGTGIVANGELVRAGRGLHPEAGHMIIDWDAENAVCGCGNVGCAEALLSGNGFGRWASKSIGRPGASPREIAELARRGDRKALAAFERYAQLLAVALHNYVNMFAPEIVVFTGSFADAHDLFLPSAKRRLQRMLARKRKGVDMLPKLALSKLQNRAGIIGGAWVAFHQRG